MCGTHLGGGGDLLVGATRRQLRNDRASDLGSGQDQTSNLEAAHVEGEVDCCCSEAGYYLLSGVLGNV